VTIDVKNLKSIVADFSIWRQYFDSRRLSQQHYQEPKLDQMLTLNVPAYTILDTLLGNSPIIQVSSYTY
jgi:hypothetical protein